MEHDKVIAWRVERQTPSGEWVFVGDFSSRKNAQRACLEGHRITSITRKEI